MYVESSQFLFFLFFCLVITASSQHTQGPVDGSIYATILKSPKSYQTSPPKPLRTSTQSLISPPVEFSSNNYSKHSIDTPDSKFHSSTPAVHTYGKLETGHYEDVKTIQENRSSARNTPTPSVVSYASSKQGHSQSRYHQGPSVKPQEQYYNGHSTETNGYGQASGGQREFVRSPLTLSMDSGISSSGVVNRGGQVQGGSSVSPTSFPSQASPQGK